MYKRIYAKFGEMRKCTANNCQNIFQPITANKAQKYCSQKCLPGRKRSVRYSKICLYCSTTFEVQPCFVTQKYCSKKCSDKSRIGTKRSESEKLKISRTMSGMVANNKGKKATNQARQNMREAQLKRVKEGKHNNYKGGISDENHKLRNSLPYKLWREEVFVRDNYTCSLCEKRGGQLHVDHVKEFSKFPEVRLAIDNGATLCVRCHYSKTFNKIMPYDSKWGKRVRIKEMEVVACQLPNSIHIK